MRIKIFISIFVFLLTIAYSQVQAQGCSDAGACAISYSEPGDNKDKSGRTRLFMEQSVGLGEKFVFISQTTLEARYQLSKKSLVSLRAPFIFVTGNLGTTAGVGDFLLSINQQLFMKNHQRWDLVLGGRLPSNRSDFQHDNKPLPMAYQTSLGTYDIILGTQYTLKKLDFYLAWQHPFNRNNNGYLHPDGENRDSYLYYESSQLLRGDDLYFRNRYHISLKENRKLTLNALFIYRLQKDEIVKSGETILLDGSEGLTVNLGINYATRIFGETPLNLLLAFPVKDKASRPDGLTRNVVLSARIEL